MLRILLIGVVNALLLPGFVFVFDGAQDLVLCVADDGHVGIEAAHDGVCVSGVAESSEPPSYEAIRTGHCGACTDIPIGVELIVDLARVSRVRSTVAASDFVVLLSTVDLPKSGSRSGCGVMTAPLPGTVVPIRSAVLRC